MLLPLQSKSHKLIYSKKVVLFQHSSCKTRKIFAVHKDFASCLGLVGVGLKRGELHCLTVYLTRHRI